MEKEKSSSAKPFYQDWQIAIAFACVILGIMVALQFRTQKGEGFPFYNERAELIQMIRNLESERNKLQAELTDTRSRLEKYVEAAGKGETAVAALDSELNKVRIQAGLTAVEGPGIAVRLNDSIQQPMPKDDPYFYIVHDVDLQTLVNELWAAGAEAVSINEQRIIANSSIRCAGPIILVNAVRCSPPYEIKAIGPPVPLETALRMRGGFVDSMVPYIQKGVELKISRKEKITVPSYTGSLIFRYATPAQEVEK